jgi:hypothetical protein
LIAGLSEPPPTCFATVLPLLLKTAPPFTLPSVSLICSSTELEREALRFCFALLFLPGFQRKVGLINHRENIIPLPFPIAPVKVIRYKPIDGILTTHKHNPGTLRRFIAAFTQPFPSPAPDHHHASKRVRVIPRPYPAM